MGKFFLVILVLVILYFAASIAISYVNPLAHVDFVSVIMAPLNSLSNAVNGLFRSFTISFK